MNSPERRANPRFACDLDATLEAEGAEPIAARTQDISFSGFCVMSEGALAAGSKVKISVQLVMEGFHSDKLDLFAHVVWCTKLRDGYQVGGRFDPKMGDELWSKLDVLIRFLTGELTVDPGASDE